MLLAICAFQFSINIKLLLQIILFQNLLYFLYVHFNYQINIYLLNKVIFFLMVSSQIISKYDIIMGELIYTGFI